MRGYAISNLAWAPANDKAVAEILKKNQVKAVELAPTKLWPDWYQLSSAELLS